MTTHDLIKRLRNLGPLGKIMEELVIVAADRLEELQRLNESMQVDRDLWIKVGREKLEAAYATGVLPVRPDPSRLEIAAMLKAGWFANGDADFNATDHGWWIEQADALIAAAKETK